MSVEQQSNSSGLQGTGFSRRVQWASQQAISYLMAQAVENPGVLSLAAGLVDEQTLPVELTRELSAELCADPVQARSALQYGTTAGSESLRRAVCRHLASLEQQSPDDLPVSPRDIVLTAGSQQLLSLVADVLLDPGDICFVAAPTYFVFLGVLNGVGARTIPIPADDQGMRTDLLEQALQRVADCGELDRVKLIYLVTEFENPSGACLSAERRRHVLQLAREWSRSTRIRILEDAAYRELRYRGDSLASIWSLDERHESVILAHTFSKSFSPGIRVGYGVLPDDLTAPILNRKGNQDFGSPHWNQRLLALAMNSGRYAAHVAAVRVGYARKLEVFDAALTQAFRDLPEVHWIRPEGGLYVWMSLPESIPTGFDSRLFQTAVHDHRVMYVPGELCYATERRDGASPAGTAATDIVPRHQMRLSFGMLDEAGLAEGAQRLAAAVRHTLER